MISSGRLSLLFLSLLSLSTNQANGYEIGCIYPAGMPDPVTAQVTMLQYLALVNQRDKVETPIVIHKGLMSGLCGATCLAMHDPKALYPLTMTRPLLVVPEFGHNAHSIAMCNLQCHVVAAGLDVMQPLLDRWGIHMPTLFHPDLEFLSKLQWKENKREPTTQEMLQAMQVIQKNDYHPYLVGQAAIMSIYKDYANIDGWNNLGNYTYDPITKEVVPCVHNCMPYSDLSGYHPRNHPGQNTITEENKYNVTGTDQFWQPLLEDDGFGYFSRQQHVVPHLGKTAKSVGNPNLRNKTLPSPNYDYYAEALQVVEQLRVTASNKTRQVHIDFFDNKVDVAGLIKHEMQQQFSQKHSYQRRIVFGFGLLMAEDDGVLLSWTEKVKHDLVRPTTVIQRWGVDPLITYSGDRSLMEPVEIPARNFEAFVRVMPHAEYPSGSSCLCTIFREYTDGYTQKYYGKKINGLEYGPEGHSVNCGGHIDPDLPQGLACNDDSYIFTLKDMTELEQICGESRLWGGMHFSKSVPAGSELCTGVGSAALEFIEQMMAGTDFGGNEWFVGDAERPPKCSTPSMDQTGSDALPTESDGDYPDYNFSAGVSTRIGASTGVAILTTMIAAFMAPLYWS